MLMWFVGVIRLLDVFVSVWIVDMLLWSKVDVFCIGEFCWIFFDVVYL